MRSLQKPPALRPGDTLGVIAPSGPVKPELLAQGVQELQRIGYRVVLGDGILSSQGYFAGGHRQRAEAFLDLLANPDINGIFCARGGYGSNYVVEYLAAPAVLRRLRTLPPRIVMGYSDVTSLLLFFSQRLGWVTFQGPMLTKDFAEGEAAYDRCVLERVLSDPASGFILRSNALSLRAGVAEGKLVGGCLSLLTATLGTPEEIDTRGAILLLEDIDEKPYRIDRMLFQLRRAGKFQGVAAFVFGEMIGCRPASSPVGGLHDVILDAIGKMKVPIVFGFPFGHTNGGNLTIPLGVRARLSAGREVTLRLLEPSVNRHAPSIKKFSKPGRSAGS